MTLKELSAGWNRVVTALRDRNVLREYALVVELQKRGAPHIHALATGEFLPQAELSELVQGRPGSKGRFGKVTDIRLVRTTGPRSLAAYIAKRPALSGKAEELARYAAKAGSEERARLRLQAGAARTRPVRTSKLWYPGGQKAAAAAVKHEWSKGIERPGADATDWKAYRIRQDTGEVVELLLSAPVLPPEVDTRTGLALVPSLAPALPQAA